MSKVELIDRRKLVSNLKALRSNVTFTDDIRQHLTWAITMAERAPTVKLKNGKWVDINGDNTAWKCDQCDAIACCNDNFCPNCGADMRGNDK